MASPFPVSPAEPRTNTLFALEPQPGAAFVNPFAGTRRLTIDAGDGSDAGIEVLAGAGAHVETLLERGTGCRAYLWGLAAHPDVARGDLLRWCVRTVANGEHAALRQVVGVFILLIDDRRRGRVDMISDTMGLRPWFVGRHEGRLVCGSDVWLLQEAGMDVGSVNLDAIASWLRYTYDCTGQSLFTNFPQIGYGAIGTWRGGTYSEVQYATFTGTDEKPPQRDLIEGIHDRVSRTFVALTRDLDHVTVALSGGYDRRYLAALATRQTHLRVEAFSVRDREAEGVAATMVGQALGLPLEVLRTDGSRFNMYEEPIHFTAGGFPMTKQVSHLAAAQRPGVPCLNGFIGDPIVRGTLDRAEKKLSGEITEDLTVVFQRIHRLKSGEARFDLIDPRIVRRCDERTLAVWRREMPRWQHTGHPFVATSLFVRQRHYIANNFLEHLHIAEAIVPFTAWEVIQYKLQHDDACYSWDTYDALFRTYFPELAPIPHNKRMATTNAPPAMPSRCTKRWAAAVLGGVAFSSGLSLLRRRKALPLLVGALAGRRFDVVALFLHRLYMLEDRLRRAGIPFDWSSI